MQNKEKLAAECLNFATAQTIVSIEISFFGRNPEHLQKKALHHVVVHGCCLSKFLNLNISPQQASISEMLYMIKLPCRFVWQ